MNNQEIRLGPREFRPPTDVELQEVVDHILKLKELRKMPSMRAKLTVESILQSFGVEQVKFRANYSDNKEDNTYSEATPNATADFTISNKSLHGQFKPGQKFYVDFTPAE